MRAEAMAMINKNGNNATSITTTLLLESNDRSFQVSVVSASE